MSELVHRVRSAGTRHLLLSALGFAALSGWLWAHAPLHGGFIAHSDLYKEYLPTFLSPFTWWSSFEFGGAPSFASPSEATWYPVHLLFRDVLHWLPAFIASANVIGAVGAYLAVFAVTGSCNAALFSGLAYGLSEALIDRVSHLATMHTVAWFPWVIWTVDRLRRPPHWPAVPAAALALAMFFLAGNPQTFLYGCYFCCVYALVGGVAERSSWRFYAAGMAAIGLGSMLCAIEALPMLELSTQTSRDTVSIGQFVRGLTGPQLLSFLIPTIQHDGRGEPTYVGMLTLVFASLSLARIRRNWRVGCWLFLTVAAILISDQDLAIGRWAFDVPFYDRFRIASRHLFLAAFGFAMLAGIGVASLERQRIPARRVISLTLVVPALTVIAAWSVSHWQAHFAFDDRMSLSWLPAIDGYVALQIVLTLLAAGLVIAFARKPGSRVCLAVIILLLGADLVYAVRDITPYGLEYPMVPARAALHPSVHAARLGAALAPLQQRMLSPAGTQVDDLVPAAFARLWRIPIAGGYNSMMLANHHRVAGMENNGSVRPHLFTSEDSGLDVLATRYVAVRAADLAVGRTIERNGLPWADRSLDLSIGPDECRRTDGTALRLGIPPGQPVRAVAIAAHLTCGEHVQLGDAIATVRLEGDPQRSWPMRAGIEVGEDHVNNGTALPMRIQLPTASGDVQFTIATTAGTGRLIIDGVTAVDDTGGAHPEALEPLLFGNTSRWRETARFATSRLTDRGGDEDAEGETRYVVYENLRARPRAWLVHEIVPLGDRDIERTLHFSVLPDGQRFDAATTALIADETLTRRSFAPGEQSVRLLPRQDGLAQMDVFSPTPTFLVFSENAYPGWRATVDDRRVPIHRVNLAHMGVELPAGRHRVAFRFRPRSFERGASIAAVGLLATLAIAIVTRRRKTLQSTSSE